ncbi:MAG TPA: phosphoribosylformylglycinamidine synthase subunit PurQ [Candidatus Methylomirabilis sp.]|jgi:phosphoribosylformylglycinamidine synthase
MKFGVLLFPGTWSHQDFAHVFQDVLKVDWGYVWHKDTSVAGYDGLILPGGFAHGDYLRCGAIARFSPIMHAVVKFARDGGPVMGSCNGFQILCEAGLLPGALLRNESLQYRCRWVHMRTESTETPFTRMMGKGRVLKIPISHGEGRYFADPETVGRLRANDQIIFRYSTPDGAITDEANPNGALGNIAGICNEGRNVLGLMPHPERASEALLGSEDGRLLFESVLSTALRR